MMKKQVRGIFAAVAMVAAIGGVGTTIAYFTDTDKKTNVFTMGDLELGFREPEWDTTSETGQPDGLNMYPGYTVYKNPTIKNITSDKNGEEPCYARIRIKITDQNGKLIENEEALNLIHKMIYFDKTYNGTYDRKGQAEKLVEGRVPGYSLLELSGYPMVNPLFTKDETRSSKNSLVYNYVGTKKDGKLQIGEEATLFTNVVVPIDWNQTEIALIGDMKLEIEAESIQCSGFATPEDAFKALDEELKKHVE